MIINNKTRFSNNDRTDIGDLYAEMYSPKTDEATLVNEEYEMGLGDEPAPIDDGIEGDVTPEELAPDAEFAYEAFTKRTADRPFPYIIKTLDRDGDVKHVDFVWLSETNIFDPQDERIPFDVSPNQHLEQYVLTNEA
tara:strand:+ start:46562 stop:46972 length:411 start_codon:yes stop_codon:yes gene_type:complete